MKKMMDLFKAVLKKLFMVLLYGVLGGLVTLVLVAVLLLDKRPDLKVWHEAHLDAEYPGGSPVSNWEDYLALEARLFQQLDRVVLDHVPPADRGPIQRYHRDSLSDPNRWEKNWNRSFELASTNPNAGILLLHGMSDSPYSLRSLGLRFQNEGAWVLGLRLPGHGTVPSGLIRLKWQDMAAAVRIAIRHLKARIGEGPIFLVGFSTGGALAVNYALETFDAPTLPPVDRMVLISPAMGVTGMAALSVWQARLGRWLGLPKLAWNSILPEYNPFKYSSFAINAGDQVYRLTIAVQRRLDSALASGQLDRFPPLLTFQSVVDATVSTPAVVGGLYNRLTNPANELVVFDIRHQKEVDEILAADPFSQIQPLLANSQDRYVFSLVTNNKNDGSHVVVLRSKGDRPVESSQPLTWQWPPEVHSLSHVALPFPFDDPLYGDSDEVAHPGVALSKLTLRGERGVIKIPASEMLRLKWNPFYPYLEERVLTFLNLGKE